MTRIALGVLGQNLTLGVLTFVVGLLGGPAVNTDVGQGGVSKMRVEQVTSGAHLARVPSSSRRPGTSPLQSLPSGQLEPV